jgi:diguanylate cyclase (GGDEF)-like protein
MLALEVSENTGSTIASATFFEQVAESGVRVSLDDFGTGLASLESLGSWPIDELKLDRSIVRPVVASASFRAIVGNTIDLAHQLGIRVVAEGIESEAIRSELRALGCDTGQGFFLGRPMPAARFTEWMRDQARHASHPEAAGYPQASEVRPVLATGAAIRALRRAIDTVGGRALAVALATTIAYGLWQVFRWGGRENQALIGDVWFIPVNVAAALLTWRASRRADLGRDARRAWRLLTIVVLVYTAGDLLQLVHEAVLHRSPQPTWAAAVYLSFYPVAFWALISFPADRRRPWSEQLRLLLDTGLVFTGGAMLIWYVSLGPAVAASGPLNLTDLITYSYPIGDLLLLFGALAVLLRAPPQSSLALRMFAVAMLVFIVADLVYAQIMVSSAYRGGDPVDSLWMLATVTVCLAAACQLRTRSTGVLAPLPRPSLRPSFVPYLAIASSYLLLAVIGLRNVRFDSVAGGLLVGAVALTFLVSARQYLALHDYRRLADRYQKLASVDGITGVYNRRHFMEIAEATFARSQRTSQPLVALMIDVDNFKQINDTHGHVVGDQVLAEMAEACREHVRPEDLVGRYGGDEFIIIVVGVTSPRATQIAEQLARRTVGGLGQDGNPLTYTASLGIAERLPGCDLPTLLIHADQAMYEAKRAGGGRWRIYRDTVEAMRQGT